jgi:hypothetical protein
VSSGCGARYSSAALCVQETSPPYQLGRASPALVKARSTCVHHANPQVHFAPIVLATDSARRQPLLRLQLRLRLPAPEIIPLRHYLQIIRCGSHTLLFTRPLRNSFVLEKGTPQKPLTRRRTTTSHAKPLSTIIHTQNTRSLHEPSESRPSPLASITSERLTRLRTQACTAFHTSTSNHTL